MKLWFDLETYSETPITSGAHKYAENAEILLFAWAVDDGPVSVWDCTESPDVPALLAKAIEECEEYWGHNSGNFDRIILKHALKNLTFKDVKHRDTMVQALCHGLPGALEALGAVFSLAENETKDKKGKKLIQMFCKPQAKNSKIERRTRHTNPEEWAQFIEYAKKDIVSMRVLHGKMPKWNYPVNAIELHLWQMDQNINEKGIFVDLELAEKAITAVDLTQSELAQNIQDRTNGELTSATQRDALLRHILHTHGVALPDLKASTLERRLEDPTLPDGVKELLNIRLMASTSSVSKYKRVIGAVSNDGYLKGIIQFSGAGRTGRDAGRLFQPQNLMRPTLPPSQIEEGIEFIKGGYAHVLTDNVMELCANAMRGVIIAPPKFKIVGADLSNIEGRVLAWLAGENWKVQAFRDFDAGVGPDLYCASYAKSFGADPSAISKNSLERSVGKVLELAMGFGGGVGSFVTFAAAYRLDLPALLSQLKLPNDVMEDAENFWDWSIDTQRVTYGLPKNVFIACDALKRLWRRSHPHVHGFWNELTEGYTYVVTTGKPYHVGKLRMDKIGEWLRIRLPGGRFLSYAMPQSDARGLSYMGMNQYSRKWNRISTYGGKLAENITQAVARDVFKNSYPAVTEAGYSIRLPIHDELLTYAPDTEKYCGTELSELMARQPVWADDLPLAAVGFESYRYRKH